MLIRTEAYGGRAERVAAGNFAEEQSGGSVTDARCVDAGGGEVGVLGESGEGEEEECEGFGGHFAHWSILLRVFELIQKRRLLK
jgi:hypothetical protein